MKALIPLLVLASCTTVDARQRIFRFRQVERRVERSCSNGTCYRQPVEKKVTEKKTEVAVDPQVRHREVFRYRGALSELNKLRAQRGLPPFQEDPGLTAIAKRKADIQAQRWRVFHPGGSMGGARYEGVGSGSSFNTC